MLHPARSTDPSTSHESADKIDIAFMESLVVKVLFDFGPMTSEEVSDKLGMRLVSVSPRFRPLANKRVIIDTGEKRKNKSGRSAIVWKLIKKEKES